MSENVEADTAPVRKECPEESANIISRVTFWWLNWLIFTGYKRPLKDNDLWNLGEDNKATSFVPKLQHEWAKELEKSQMCQKKRVEQERSLEEPETVRLKADQDETKIVGKRIPQPSLVKAMIRVFGWYFARGAVAKLLSMVFLFTQPYLLRLLIEYTEDKGKTSGQWTGYLYAVCMFVVGILELMLKQQFLHISFTTAMRTRTAVVSSVFLKSLRLSNASRRKSTAGEMVNLMAVDTQRLSVLIQFLNHMWSAPMEICVAIYFLYDNMGPSVLAGVAVLILVVPANIGVSHIIKKLKVEEMEYKDERTKLINEILSGIKVLKLYAWEESFMAKVLGIRDKELRCLTNGMYMDTLILLLSFCSPFLVSVATFAVYVLSGNELTASSAFVAISLFNVLRLPLFLLPRVLVYYIQAQVSIKRLTEFLKLEESRPDNVLCTMPSYCNHQAVIHVDCGHFGWDRNEAPILEDINLNVNAGSLVAVVGQVGCGKSTLLSALLGETEKLGGQVYVKGSTAYVPQQAWIQNTSLQENILFGQAHDPAVYDSILEACALKPDIEILPAGDKTEIGEKGINLSGGQKQRVSLARAVYFNADLYLLDDPLSAVDSHVGKHIFDKVIGPAGLLGKKSRIFVTHGVQFLPQVDQILVLKAGRISEVGTYTELLANNGAFAEFLKTHGTENNGQKEAAVGNSVSAVNEPVNRSKTQGDVNPTKEEFSSSSQLGPDMEHKRQSMFSINSVLSLLESTEPDCLTAEQESLHDIFDAANQRKLQENLNPGINKRHSAASLSVNSILSREGEMEEPDCQSELEGFDPEDNLLTESQRVLATDYERNEGTFKDLKVDVKKKEKGKMISEERSQTGRVKLSVFVAYARSMGALCSLCVPMFALMAESSIVGSRVWLSAWSSANVSTNQQRDNWMGVYGAFGIGQAIFTSCMSFTLAFSAVKAAKTLHANLLENIFHSPMAFFETVPLGRIVNRFSKDVNVIDDAIPRSVGMFLRTLLTVTGIVSVISYSTPWFLISVVPLFAFYFFVQRVYVASSRQLRRIESVSRSPIYSHFFETISGISTIRAFSQQPRFTQDNYYKVDENQKAHYPAIAANRWLAIRLEFVGAGILFFAALFAVISRNSIAPGLVGLSISCALQITTSLNWMVRQTCELETNIISVERVKEYSETPREMDWIVPSNRPPDDWPQEGKVEAAEFCLRYRDGPLVLRDISCVVRAGEKVGIVGRTGAGKSTLTLALFRLLERAGGKIVIDGIDISSIGLQDLRSRLTIIPQDPVLFSGPLRANLDPFEQHTDEELWRALEVTQLKEHVSDLPGGLLHLVVEGGENLSVGQRQLVCLARALLRHSKILVLDEATAAVDLETDELIQQTIRREFADRTVLTIAHRLNTIMDYNRIMVLSEGSIVEFDTPVSLLSSKGVFYKMLCDAGLS